jgi:hypothetical protein
MGFSVGAIAERLSSGVGSVLLVLCFSWEFDTPQTFLHTRTTIVYATASSYPTVNLPTTLRP